jgi:hypothetical protein
MQHMRDPVKALPREIHAARRASRAKCLVMQARQQVAGPLEAELRSKLGSATNRIIALNYCAASGPRRIIGRPSFTV